MARPLKKGLDYFPFDIDFFEDEKIGAISGEFGIKGEIATIKLLCAVYRNGYFLQWNEVLRMKLLKVLPGISAELLDQIVNRLVKWGFYDQSLFDSDKVLTSVGIQTRYFEAIKRRRTTEEFPFLLVNVCNNGVTVCNNPITADNNTQSKGKERKGKNIPPTPPKGEVVENNGRAGIEETSLGNKAKPAKKELSLNAKSRKLFENHYRNTFSADYYWTAKDAGSMLKILQKLEFQRKKKNMEISDESILYALQFLLNSVSEGWIFENFSVTNINSKFNEIVSKAVATHGKNGKINSASSGGRGVNPATDYAAAANAPATFEDACKLLDMLDGR